MIKVEDWAEVRRLNRSEHLGVKAIARRLGLARNTVRSALAADAPPKYSRAPQGSRVDEFEPAIRRLLTQFPEMPATVIAERIGWEHSSCSYSGGARHAGVGWMPAWGVGCVMASWCAGAAGVVA